MKPRSGHNHEIPEQFRKYFWDVDPSALSLEKSSGFIAERIMNFGDQEAIKWLLTVLDTEFIKSLVADSRNLTPKTRNYWQVMFHTQKNS